MSSSLLFGNGKGDKPYTVKNLYSKLSKLWNVVGKWRMVSLGCGFYEFQFATFEDLLLVWTIKNPLFFSMDE
jgi:hypothetical protein